MELPSQFMENWCYHRETLIGLSEHVETKEKLPDKFFEKILAARTFRSASFMLRQLNFGVLDLELHHRYEPDSDETVFDVQRRVADKTTVLPPIAEDRFLCGFSHILTVSPTNQSGDSIFRSTVATAKSRSKSYGAVISFACGAKSSASRESYNRRRSRAKRRDGGR